MVSSPTDLLPLILIPFTGVLVRYRASYHPKPIPIAPSSDAPATGTDDENSATSSVSPMPSMWGMFKRVKLMDGWAGLYKGFLPTLLTSIIPYGPRLYMSPSPSTTYWSLQSALFYNLLYCFGLILTYRAIITTEKLELFGTSVRTAFRALFTEHERKKPWVLLLTPGPVPVFLLNIILQSLVFRPLGWLIQPSYTLPTKEFLFLSVAGRLTLLLLTTAVLAPLDVIVTRLAIQRNYGDSSVEEVIDPEKVVESGDSEEVVVQLRCEHDLYIGLYDCAKRIVQEEGWGVLYRGWWVTGIGNLYL